MPTILGIVCKWFSFFWFLSSSSRTRARTVWSWWLWQWWFVATSHHLKHQTSPKHLIAQAFGPARLARGLDNVFLAKLPPESYTRNLLWAARASELKQFDDMVTFTFQKDTSYIHTLHIFFYSPGIGWKKTDMEKLVRLVGTLEWSVKKSLGRGSPFTVVLLDPFVGLVLETLDICETFLKNHSWLVGISN